MNAMQFVERLRRSGETPECVFLDVVAGKAQPAWYAGHGVHAEIGPDESIADIDFRPLVGVPVQLGARGGDAQRMRCIAKRVAEAKPSLLCVFTDENGAFVMHRLWADGRSDRRSV